MGVTIVSVAFTLLYFVLVEAMSKTFGVLHSDRAALAVAPARVVPRAGARRSDAGAHRSRQRAAAGRGLKEGPFVSEADVRSMAEVGHEEGASSARRRS